MTTPVTELPVKHETIAEALSAIRDEVGPLFRGAEADTGKYTYRYVTLPALVALVDPIMKRHGVFIRHQLNLDVLRHELWFNDQNIEAYDVALPNPTGTAQGLGSAITYLRRYDYTTTLGLVVDLDDDGAAASVQPDSRLAGAGRDSRLAPNVSPITRESPLAASIASHPASQQRDLEGF